MVKISVRYLKHFKRKVGFLVIDLTWRLFSHTGNIETYLLWKELESDSSINSSAQNENEVDEINTNM